MGMANTPITVAQMTDVVYISTTSPDYPRVKAESRRLSALRAKAVAAQDWAEMNRLTIELAKLPVPKVGR